MGMTILPTFKGYTIDIRLHEFRKAEYDELPEFIAFDSLEGQQLFSEWKEFARKMMTLENQVFGS